MRSKTLFIAVCSLLAGSARATPPAAAGGVAACLRCHPRARGILDGPMATRGGERAFARRAFDAGGERFFAEACAGCHVTTCADCHGADPHLAGRPGNDACLRCHRGDSAGWEYVGRAPREDHARYRRGATEVGEPFLTMLPDVHFERGLLCADCHPMSSLHGGGRRAKGCRDCHPSVSAAVPEHAVAAHLAKMTCVSCHAAWASQEYGTFLIRPANREQADAFAPLRTWGPWKKSAHTKRQDAPPLGLDAVGLVAPIRPRYVLFVTDTNAGWENRMVAAEWRAFSPHTVRRGAAACGGCHTNRRRFLLERDDERIERLEEDGLPLRSWASAAGQTMTNGSFFPRERFERMNVKSPEYRRQVVARWRKLIEHAAPRSKR